MFVVRDVFRCKPGHARDIAERFRKLVPSMEREDGFQNVRVMVDYVTTYWTVVIEADFETLDQFERHAREFGTRPEVKETMAGYMDVVEGGHREMYRLF